MKKSILVILSMLLMSMTVHAVGVDCWEEYSTTFLPDTKSRMATLLGDDVTIKMVKADIDLTTYFYSSEYPDSFEEVSYPISNVSPVYGNYDGKPYYPKFEPPTYNGSKGYLYVPEKRAYTLDNSDYRSLKYMGYYDNNWSYYLGTGTNSYEVFMAYKFTYCIVSDHSSSGGGGGTSGASVNYIIKAN